MRIFYYFLFSLLFSTTSFAQQLENATPSKDNYLIQLDIPSDWDIKRSLEGKDYTLTASSRGDILYLYYVQFMEDDKKQPKRYLHTYASQFGMDAPLETINKKINGKKTKFYVVNGVGSIVDEKAKILIWATVVDNKNITAYLLYPVDADEEMDIKVRNIMLGE